VPIYFAGPLFSKAERTFNSRLTELLERANYRAFLPQPDGVERNKPRYDRMGADERRGVLFELDKHKIFESDAFLFVLDGRVRRTRAVAYAHKGLSATQKLFVGLQTEYRAAFLGSELTSAASLTVPRTATGRGTAPTGTPITRTGSKGKGSRWTRGAPSSLATAAGSASERRGPEARRHRGRHGWPPNPRKPPRRRPHRDRPRGPR
jgi:hypothetical protein